MVDFSVAICTYNGEKRLPIVLDKLRECCSYTNENKINWEIIVIDNNSQDDTLKVVQKYQENWNENYPIKYYLESKQGLAFARQRAINEAKGIFVGFLDDDNLPTANWVASAYEFGKNHSQAGAYGGKIYGDYEVNPPNNFERISLFLGIGGSEQEFCYTSKEYKYFYKKVLPPGAGIVVRRQAWIESVPEKLFFAGRLDTSLVGGDDIEALQYISKAGWDVWHNPQMQIYHRIPQQRLQKNYLLKLMRGVGLTRHHTRMLAFPIWQRFFVFLIYLINDLRKIILHLWKYRRVIKSDVVAASELELLVGSLISPFYMWGRSLYWNQD